MRIQLKTRGKVAAGEAHPFPEGHTAQNHRGVAGLNTCVDIIRVIRANLANL